MDRLLDAAREDGVLKARGRQRTDSTHVLTAIRTLNRLELPGETRLSLDWEQRDLASHSGLSLPTIRHMEKLGMERSQAGNVRRVQQALETAGVEFIPENGGGAGIRLWKPGQ